MTCALEATGKKRPTSTRQMRLHFIRFPLGGDLRARVRGSDATTVGENLGSNLIERDSRCAEHVLLCSPGPKAVEDRVDEVARGALRGRPLGNYIRHGRRD